MRLFRNEETKSCADIWGMLSERERMIFCLGALWNRQVRFNLDIHLKAFVSRLIPKDFLVITSEHCQDCNAQLKQNKF